MTIDMDAAPGTSWPPMPAPSTAAASSCSTAGATRPAHSPPWTAGDPDGGYGWGLEGDLRSPESQPAAALHAFEVFEEVAPATTPRARGAVRLARARHAVRRRPADGRADGAHRRLRAVVARRRPGRVVAADHQRRRRAVRGRSPGHDPAVAEHPWLERALLDYRRIALLAPMTSAGSPGSNCCRRKISTDTKNSVGIELGSRRERKPTMARGRVGSEPLQLLRRELIRHPDQPVWHHPCSP